jgi:hypothetical protein
MAIEMFIINAVLILLTATKQDEHRTKSFTQAV